MFKAVPMPISIRSTLLAFVLSFASPISAQVPDIPFSAEEIEAAEYTGGDLPGTIRTDGKGANPVGSFRNIPRGH